jgi:hypothetical protein
VRPAIDELLAAVRWTIEEALLPEVSGPYARFQAMIAIDLLDLIGRHWSTRIADLSADVRDFTAALDQCRQLAPAALDPGLRDAIEVAVADPLPPIPNAHDELARRADHLAGLIDRALAGLEAAGETGAAGETAATAALRRALLAQLDRTGDRQAGIDIRR